MDTITLDRWYTPWGTWGRLRVGVEVFYTVERPWLDNTPFISCIPEAVYEIVPGYYHRGKRGGYPCYEVVDVPGRDLIKIHIANFTTDVEGCIGVGVRPGALNGQWAVVDSRRAFGRFMRLLDGRPYWLDIRRASI